MPDTPFLSALELGQRIRDRKISSVELTTLYLDRLEKHGPELGALVTLTRELALAQAAAADQDLHRGRVRSVLHGVPYGIKDLFSTANIPTSWGSPIYHTRIIDHDSAVVVKLREAGCPLLGKLAMVEFAGSVGYRYANASVTGAGRTPWNPERWSGGSSSGSGAAVSAGLVAFAIGTETWGSIVCPAAFCGVAGLRPTAGRVSRDGAMALSWTMDKVGPLARTTMDCATVLELISGPQGTDLLERPEHEAKYTAPKKLASIRGLRLGIVHPDYGDGEFVQPETEKVFHTALNVFEQAGAILSEAILPNIPIDEAAGTIVQAEAASAFEGIARDAELWNQVVDPEMRAGLIASLAIPAVDYVRALRIRGRAQAQVPELFSQFDALIAPTYLQVAPPITANLDDYFVGGDGGLGGFGNMLGLPAVSVPMGFGAGTLPLGLQLVGAPLAEDRLIALANSYESATTWHQQTPPLFS